MNRSLFTFLLPAIFAASLCSNLEGSAFRVVATSGAPVPGGAAPFESFGALALNNAGQVAFSPRYSVSPYFSNSAGVWLDTPGQGFAMVDPPQYGHWDLTLNNAGQTAFTKGSALVRGSSLA